MDTARLATLNTRLYELTPLMVNDLLEIWSHDPQMSEKYGTNLRPMAEQGVNSFRDILLGALEFELPSLVKKELVWLDNLLAARHLEGRKVAVFLVALRHRFATSLSPEEATPLLKLLDALIY